MGRWDALGLYSAGSWLAAATGGLLLTAGASTLAAHPEVYVGLDSRFSDNIELASGDEQRDIENRMSLRGNYQTDPGRCTAVMDGEVAYSVYAEGTYDPQTQVNAGFTGICELASGLGWELDDQVRELSRTSRQGDTPDNRTRKNVFRTGPSYRLRLSEVDFINLSARYENTEVSDDNDPDSDRVTGSVAWNHLFAPDLSGGVSISASEVELDTGAEIRNTAVTATFSKRWAKTSVSGSLGVSEIETELGSFQQKSDGVVGDVNFQRSLDAGGTLYLRASRELTDQTSDFDIRFDEFTFQSTDSNTLEATSVEAGLNKTLSNGDSVTVAAFANRSDYLESAVQEDNAGLRTIYTRRLSPRFSANAGARYEYLTFESDQSDDEIVGIDLGLTYRASRSLELAARIGRTERTSDIRLLEYEEHWLLLSVDYRLW
jgi:putative beta-barrel porin BBP2